MKYLIGRSLVYACDWLLARLEWRVTDKTDMR
jgi:hypothetical protein